MADAAATPLAPQERASSEPDRIERIRLSSVRLPLDTPVSDAKVLTGRQRPLREVIFLFAEVMCSSGASGLGFSYSKRAGGPALFTHANEIAPAIIGEDPSDIARLWDKLVWAGASVGRSGVATQATAAIDIALWDLKAKRAGLSAAKLIGSYRESVRTYNTSGGFLNAPVGQIIDNSRAALAAGIGGIKIKVGQPDWRTDVARLTAVREALGADVPLMVDANQQWDRHTALRMGRILDDFNLVWIEEPLDAYDVEGHAELSRLLDTPIATGEMLVSPAEHDRLIDGRAADILQPDAARVGGVTPFLKVAAYAEHHHVPIAPHFAMELHVQLAAAYPLEPWVEHFDWLEPLFTDVMVIADGRMTVPSRAGFGLTLTEQANRWTLASADIIE